jgi:hypothetical protein
MAANVTPSLTASASQEIQSMRSTAKVATPKVALVESADQLALRSRVVNKPSHMTRWLSDSGRYFNRAQVKAMATRENNFHYGFVTAEMADGLGVQGDKVHKMLDAIAENLQSNRPSLTETRTISLKKGNPVTARYINQGHDGAIYSVQIGDKPYKLKVFHPGTAGTDIQYKEVSRGAFMTRFKPNNVAHLHLANLHDKRPWTLSTLVDENATEIHPSSGKPIEHYGVTLANDAEGKNLLNGKILIDHGVDLNLPTELMVSKKEFPTILNLFKKPHLGKKLLKTLSSCIR